MTKIYVMLAALVLAIGTMVGLSSSPATAAVCTLNTGLYCGHMKHFSPDDGYSPGIIIECEYGSGDTHYLYEGESSTKYCKDMDRVYVRAGEELWCKYRLYDDYGQAYDKWLLHYDATGWHKWTNGESDGYGCTLRKD